MKTIGYIGLLCVSFLVGCQPTIEVEYQTSNDREEDRHGVYVDVIGPGHTEHLGIIPYAFSAYRRDEFDVTNPRATAVYVNIAVTDVVNEDFVTFQVLLKEDHINLIRINEFTFGFAKSVWPIAQQLGYEPPTSEELDEISNLFVSDRLKVEAALLEHNGFSGLINKLQGETHGN